MAASNTEENLDPRNGATQSKEKGKEKYVSRNKNGNGNGPEPFAALPKDDPFVSPPKLHPSSPNFSMPTHAPSRQSKHSSQKRAAVSAEGGGSPARTMKTPSPTSSANPSTTAARKAAPVFSTPGREEMEIKNGQMNDFSRDGPFGKATGMEDLTLARSRVSSSDRKKGKDKEKDKGKEKNEQTKDSKIDEEEKGCGCRCIVM
jgi:hypothetical protein